MSTITSKQIIEWTVCAHKRRMVEGVQGAWWELIPEDQRELARQWAIENGVAVGLFHADNVS